MLKKRNQFVMYSIMIFMMLFAVLAPTISHALVQYTGNPSFTQKICASNGAKIVIEVKTTMGRALFTTLDSEQTLKNSNPQTAENHFEHCPFCTNLHMDAALAKPHDLIIAKLVIEAQKADAHARLNGFLQTHFSPPSQAPPQTSK